MARNCHPRFAWTLKWPTLRTTTFAAWNCARRWLAGQSGAVLKAAIVRDALNGDPIDSYVAFFVRSEIVTNRSNGNNIHAFRYRTDAMDHIHRFGGELIADPLAAP